MAFRWIGWPFVHGTLEHEPLILARQRFLDDLDRQIRQRLLDHPALLHALERHVDPIKNVEQIARRSRQPI